MSGPGHWGRVQFQFPEKRTHFGEHPRPTTNDHIPRFDLDSNCLDNLGRTVFKVQSSPDECQSGWACEVVGKILFLFSVHTSTSFSNRHVWLGIVWLCVQALKSLVSRCDQTSLLLGTTSRIFVAYLLTNTQFTRVWQSPKASKRSSADVDARAAKSTLQLCTGGLSPRHNRRSICDSKCGLIFVPQITGNCRHSSWQLPGAD